MPHLKNWIEISDQSGGLHNVNNDIFKTTMFMPSLCGYSNAYILANRRITITGGHMELMMQQNKQMKEIKE